jgi:hypothetical protein
MKYQHTQVGKIILAIVILSLVASILSITVEDFSTYAPDWMDTTNWDVIGIVIVTFVYIILLNMALLTIRVDKTNVSWHFGFGFPRNSLAIADIETVKAVRNKWWYGFGIRRVFSGATIYNVEGLDAVELTTSEGKKIRLGSDDPKRLLKTIAALIDTREAA